MLRILLAVLLVMLIIGMLPVYPYSASWGYFPSGGALIVLVVALVLLSNRRGTLV